MIRALLHAIDVLQDVLLHRLHQKQHTALYRGAKKKRSLYNTKYLLIVTDRATKLALTGLLIGDLTGS
jgi:hypothetical protein